MKKPSKKQIKKGQKAKDKRAKLAARDNNAKAKK